MAFRFAGDLFRSSLRNEDEDEQQGLRLEELSLEDREMQRKDDEALRELERNQQSIRTAIERLKAKRNKRSRF